MLPRRLDKRNKTAASQEAAVFLLEGDGSGTDDIPVPVEGFLGSPVSGGIVHEDQAEAVAVTAVPLEVVGQGPVEIAADIGTVPGVIIGAVLMGVINLGMSVMGIDQNFQKVVKGLVLLAAVIFDVMSKKNDSR